MCFKNEKYFLKELGIYQFFENKFHLVNERYIEEESDAL